MELEVPRPFCAFCRKDGLFRTLPHALLFDGSFKQRRQLMQRLFAPLLIVLRPNSRRNVLAHHRDFRSSHRIHKAHNQPHLTRKRGIFRFELHHFHNLFVWHQFGERPSIVSVTSGVFPGRMLSPLIRQRNSKSRALARLKSMLHSRHTRRRQPSGHSLRTQKRLIHILPPSTDHPRNPRAPFLHPPFPPYLALPNRRPAYHAAAQLIHQKRPKSSLPFLYFLSIFPPFMKQ